MAMRQTTHGTHDAHLGERIAVRVLCVVVLACLCVTLDWRSPADAGGGLAFGALVVALTVSAELFHRTNS
jgi:hypothetical protein